MMISYEELKTRFKNILIKVGFSEQKAELCSKIFAENSRDGVHSHGVNRFPVFVEYVKHGIINIHGEPKMIYREGVIEHWEGNHGPGMYNATLAMKRAIELAKENNMGCVTLRNTNHWMRGGTYGWQAAEENCIGICATNTIANMPPWGSKEPRLGNNPLVIAIPRKKGHVVLDMAMSQFSYGKLQEYELAGKDLPVPGGYDEQDILTSFPGKIRESQRTLPIGYWKGSGLSLMIDLLVASLSGGKTVEEITKSGKEFDLSQIFICIDSKNISESIIERTLLFTKGKDLSVRYPGEQVRTSRNKSLREGIIINDKVWEELLTL